MTPDSGKLKVLRQNTSAEVIGGDGDEIELNNITAAEIGALAMQNQIVLHRLTDVAPSLEDAFMEMTQDSVAFHGHGEK